MNGAMPVPGPIKMSGVDQSDGSRNSEVGLGKILIFGIVDSHVGDPESVVPCGYLWDKNGEQMVSKYRVATPPIRLALSVHVMSVFVGGIT
jgi:hypothetical protein